MYIVFYPSTTCSFIFSI